MAMFDEQGAAGAQMRAGAGGHLRDMGETMTPRHQRMAGLMAQGWVDGGRVGHDRVKTRASQCARILPTPPLSNACSGG
ncbi:hypothetical protein SALB1_0307 [Salinisphaera sp. LB1]|nr:hypothetical protein SALB1_0307 [Salinisphaera sp. LB1]